MNVKARLNLILPKNQAHRIQGKAKLRPERTGLILAINGQDPPSTNRVAWAIMLVRKV